MPDSDEQHAGGGRVPTASSNGGASCDEEPEGNGNAGGSLGDSLGDSLGERPNVPGIMIFLEVLLQGLLLLLLPPPLLLLRLLPLPPLPLLLLLPLMPPPRKLSLEGTGRRDGSEEARPIAGALGGAIGWSLADHSMVVCVRLGRTPERIKDSACS